MISFDEEKKLLKLDSTDSEKIYFEDKNILISTNTLNFDESNVLFDLPYSNIEKIIKVDYSKDEAKNYFDINVECNDKEFVFIVQELYLNLLNDDTFNKSELSKNISPRVQILSHTKKTSSYVARINKQDINYILNTRKQDEIYLEEIFESKILDAKLKNMQKKFFIVVGKFKDIIDKKQDKVGLTRLNLKDGKVMKLVAENKQDKPPIIIVHGLASSIGSSYYELIAHLRQDYTVYGFDYYTIDQEIHVSSGLLTQEVQFLSDMYEENKIPLVAHSMGGLVSRQSSVSYK